ncbi:MAG: shikimate dehydrogenase [Planctomycetales bacterium]|nr:shikimate dehydrogenase [Planctomycetales bacterium]
MICVSIGRGRHRHLMAEHLRLKQCGAKLVELRLDYINRVPQLKRLLENRPTPVIVTCRRERDGGKFTGSEEQRLMLLREAIVEGVEYVDLEDDIAGSVPRFGKTKRIVSHHDFRKTPDDLEELHEHLASLDADIVKIATMANSPHDNIRMLKLIANAKVPTVGLCMGDIGTPSRILAGKFGAPFTYATFHHERALAPGQISFEQMRDIYHYEQINADTVVYGVVADPVGHSLSPQIHNASFRQQGINAVYLPFRVPRQYLSQFVDDAPAIGLKGLSVTIPHKEAIAEKLTKVDKAVKGIAAVNTVVYKDGELVGYNTDYKAAMDAIEKGMGQLGADPSPLAGKTALILGAGGAARAIAYGLKRRGAAFVISNRTPERAEKLAEEFGGCAVKWNMRYSTSADVLINCTPIGMHPDVDESPYDKLRLPPSIFVFDTVYNPETTLLLKDARSRGCDTATGVEMFIRQASLQYYLFTGREAPTDVMLDALRRSIGAERR